MVWDDVVEMTNVARRDAVFEGRGRRCWRRLFFFFGVAADGRGKAIVVAVAVAAAGHCPRWVLMKEFEDEQKTMEEDGRWSREAG